MDELGYAQPGSVLFQPSLFEACLSYELNADYWS
jgi:hypothetical protein